MCALCWPFSKFWRGRGARIFLGLSMTRPTFAERTKQEALARQQNRCASCGTPIVCLGERGLTEHAYGESAHAHHIRHVKLGGTNAVSNCVILCWSCHYSTHEGGNYRRGSVVGEEADFPHFYG